MSQLIGVPLSARLAKTPMVAPAGERVRPPRPTSAPPNTQHGDHSGHRARSQQRRPASAAALSASTAPRLAAPPSKVKVVESEVNLLAPAKRETRAKTKPPINRGTELMRRRTKVYNPL